MTERDTPNGRPSESEDEVQTAMLLTDTEWRDLARVAHVWLVINEDLSDDVTQRRRTLCRRVIKAVD
jgi:hypothetical protein